MARENYDVLFLFGLALLLPGLLLLPMPVLRVPLGLAIVLVAPGYALVGALFSRRDELDGAVRAALSFGLSVAILPMLAFVLDVLPWGIRPWPIAISLMFWICLLSGIALWRRQTLALQGQAYAPPQLDPAGWWRGLTDRSKARYVIGGMALAGVLIAVIIVLFVLGPRTRLTEFYVLGSEGLVENYPRAVAPGQEMQVQLGITNHEGVTARYRVEVRSGGQMLTDIGPLTLETEATWEGPLRYVLAQAGDDQRIDVLLFYNDETAPYRQLRLWVNVRGQP